MRLLSFFSSKTSDKAKSNLEESKPEAHINIIERTFSSDAFTRTTTRGLRAITNRRKVKRTSSRASSLSRKSFHSAHSRVSPSERSRRSSVRNESHNETIQHKNEEYASALDMMDLLQPLAQEINWSGRAPGRGQHVEFSRDEQIPLEECGVIGYSVTAKVERVKCRRIYFARKAVQCGYRLKLKDAMNELQHLQNLRHSHIILLVGSYIQGREFAILMYPVADYHLGDFMKRIERSQSQASRPTNFYDVLALQSLSRFFNCLASAISYIHSNTTKHMDIKPANILVKEYPTQYGFEGRKHARYQVYLADFGISKSFAANDHSRSTDRSAFTPKYCAPEVYYGEEYGRAADIFSLGAVFLEMATVLCCRSREEFSDFRRDQDDRESFYATLPKVYGWIDQLEDQIPSFEPENGSMNVLCDSLELNMKQFYVGDRHCRFLTVVKSMLALLPKDRPSSSVLLSLLGGPKSCCHGLDTFQEEQSELAKESSDQLWKKALEGRESKIPGFNKNQMGRWMIQSKNTPLIKHLYSLDIHHCLAPAVLDLAIINGDSEKALYLISSLGSRVCPEHLLLAACRKDHRMVNLLLRHVRESTSTDVHEEEIVPTDLDLNDVLAYIEKAPVHLPSASTPIPTSTIAATLREIAPTHPETWSKCLRLIIWTEGWKALAQECVSKFVLLPHAIQLAASSHVQRLFDYAVRNGPSYVIESLLKSSPSASIVTVKGRHLFVPIREGQAHIVELLLENGADPDEPGALCLHLAVTERKLSIAQILLEFGARTDWKDEFGVSALELAQAERLPDFITLFTRGVNSETSKRVSIRTST